MDLLDEKVESIDQNSAEVSEINNALRALGTNFQFAGEQRLNFPSGVCSNRELIQVHLDPSDIYLNDPDNERGFLY